MPFKLLVYDGSGKIARTELHSSLDLPLYPNRLIVGQEATEADWTSTPEISKRVNVASRTLISKSQVFISVNTVAVTVGSETTLTFSGLAGPAVVKVGTMATTVSPGDPTIIFTTDVPGQFKVRFQDDQDQYSFDRFTLVAS